MTQAAQNAFDHVWAVPHKQRPDFLHSRLRGIALLIVLGTLFIVATAASGVVTGGLHGTPLKVAGIVLALLLNLALFFFAFRLMTSDEIPTKSLLIGVVVAAATWEFLQIVGGYYINHVVQRSSSTYGSVRARDRAADLAAPRRADDPVRGRDQRRRRAQAVAAKPVRRSRSAGRPEDARALAKVEERSAVEQVDVQFQQPTVTPPPADDSEQPVGGVAPGHAQRP